MIIKVKEKYCKNHIDTYCHYSPITPYIYGMEINEIDDCNHLSKLILLKAFIDRKRMVKEN